jgi:hypothetical protein
MIFSKNSFDFIYILYTILISISWTFYNGECPLTYYIKKINNDNYIAGTESTDIKDMYLVFGSKELVYYIITISLFMTSTSYYLVLKRNNYPNYIYILLPMMQLLYILSLRIQHKNLYKNKIFLLFQEFFKYYFILNFLYILYRK